MNPQQHVRSYRHQLVTAGQASPSSLGNAVAALLKRKIKDSSIATPIKIIDVGCGLGTNMSLIAKIIPDTFSTIHGIDWSPATVALHKQSSSSIYNEMCLCDSSVLPYQDDEFDIALSMENLEHLYGNGSMSSLNELQRIAKHVIITTPLPSHVINFGWIYPELVEATLDQVPLTEHDYICLESAVHKSTLFPKAMKKAGFSLESKTHGIYFGKSSELALNEVSYVAIEQFENTNQISLKTKYLELLGKSAALHAQIVSHPDYEAPPITLRPLLSYWKRIVKKIIRR
jgi:ubiquinone/menaquinone biosynthesis C-methylase UbiE